ncbi:MAG TPA: DUF1080 domain-containing protein [Thermoguttaceae bacterium]|nr:DUF1080 domain-containing protein [Thermoguttaceae bacterium]
MRRAAVASVLVFSVGVASGWLGLMGVRPLSAGQPASPKVFTDPAQAGPDFADQGEYVGQVQTDSGPVKYGAQVIALGDGKFHAVGYPGGLPGDGWDGSEKVQTDGQRQTDRIVFSLPEGRKAELRGGVITVLDADGRQIAKLQKVERRSPTLGAKPPAGAVVLFDGTTADHFQGGRMTPDGLLMEGATSKQKFGSCTIHVEFRTPFMPYARGQGRGNSGVYAQARYEVQILDSFGLEGLDNECGGIYGVARPKVNMCFPPLSWQTYDIEFRAAKWHDGKLVERPRMTVRHNGVLIHENVELPSATRAAPLPEGPEKGPLFLQNHGCPVRFRNIWIVEKNE